MGHPNQDDPFSKIKYINDPIVWVGRQGTSMIPNLFRTKDNMNRNLVGQHI